MKLLYIDLDGVLADFEGKLRSLYPGAFVYPEGSKERGEAIDFFCHFKDKRIFQCLDLMPGALEAWIKLTKVYDVYILSTPMWDLPESYSDKRRWVAGYLGLSATKKLILTHNKGLLKGDYLIDDRLKHGVDNFEGEHIHFGHGVHKDWSAIINYLKEKDKW